MRRLVVCLAILALTACQDREPTGPNRFDPPQFTHGGPLHQGPGFYFISPVPPGNEQVPGVFDDTLSPTVEIWQLTGQNGNNVRLVTTLTATVSGGGHYQVSWSGLQALDRGYYRIDVLSAPSTETHLFYGSVEVQLVDGGGSGLDIGGNSLPIKFWISTDASCPSASTCATVFNGAAQTIVVVPGGAALRFEEQFCARTSPTGECLEFITVIVSRYRGPERCIPNPGFKTASNVAVPSIQYELCLRVTTIPDNLSFLPQKVFSYMCADLRATGDRGGGSLQNAGVIRMMSVDEVDSAGGAPGRTGIGQPVTDLTGTALDPPDAVLDVCNHDVFEQHASAPSNGLARFAALAQRALKGAGRYLAPAPAHARRRANIPIISSPIGFSRLGLVVPVTAVFDHDNSVGVQNQLLPLASRPRVRVLATEPDGDRPAVDVPVPFVRVKFTPDPSDGSVSPAIDSTDTSGFVSARWTLGSVSSNPQKLKAEVGAPKPHPGVLPIFPNGEDTPSQWWTFYDFTATATQFAVHFLSPLGASGSGLTNVTLNPLPVVRVCGPLPGTSCTNLVGLRLRNNAYEVSWNTGKTGPDGALYRIEVVVNGLVTGAFHARRGGGGGGSTDPLGSIGNPYQFQNGSTIPIKFLAVAP